MSGMQMFLVGFGGLFFVGGVLMAIQRIRTVVSGASAQGTVVGQKTSTSMQKSGKSVTLYAPIVEFVHDGRKLKITSSLATTSAMPHGSKVRVVYLPDDPEGTAEIGTGVRMWGFPVTRGARRRTHGRASPRWAACSRRRGSRGSATPAPGRSRGAALPRTGS